MNIRDLNGKNVVIVGAHGREGKAMQEALLTYAPQAIITLRDRKDNAGYLENLHPFDVVIKAPGIPPYQELTKLKSTLTNATQIFLDSIPAETVVIGVTGSKGKSTTASLIHAILVEGGKESVLVGNIGDPAIAHIAEITEQTIVVIELSSYQLMQITKSPHIAVVTSFFPEHLDYHGSLEEYKDAKKSICKYQSSNDTVFYFEGSDGAKEIANTSAGAKISYTQNDATVGIEDTKLIGNHNLINIAGASAVARSLGIDANVITTAVKIFTGLPHRLYSVGTHHDTLWIDDAISTTPDSTIAAIDAVDPAILIVGGKDRGLNYSTLGARIDASSIEHVILLGENGDKIAETIQSPHIKIHKTSSMQEAVKIAKNFIPNPTPNPQPPIVLLSPASPSYDMYKSYEEKGGEFASLI
jgi:UDP-N-acetylmuramoyl-L-alanine---L-glutamate ligase